MGEENSTVSGLESLLQEVRALRQWKAEAQAWMAEAQKGWSQSVVKLNDLQRKLTVVERKPHVLDGLDEQWLFDAQAHLRFSIGLDGKRKLIVRSRRNKQIVRYGRPDQDLLQGVIDVASQRHRGRNKPSEKAPQVSAKRP